MMAQARLSGLGTSVESIPMRNALVVFAPYGFPSMGARRVRRIVRHMPCFGWAPTVLTDSVPSSVPESEIPPAPVVRAQALDLAVLYQRLGGQTGLKTAVSGATALRARDIRLTTWLTRWAMIPDKYVVWRSSALREGRKILSAGKTDLIFASHQPATNLLVAARLAREYGVPLFVEYRDLWTHNPYSNFQGGTRFHDLIHKRLERKVLSHSATVSCLARGIAEMLAKYYGHVMRQPPLLNYNFYDEAEYPNCPSRATDTFTVAYVGAMYLSREPSVWLKGLRQFIDRHSLSPAQMRFRWVGPLAGIPGLETMVRDTRVESYIDYKGEVNHRCALEELMGSHVALHIQSPDDVVHVPGKFFEALGARIPMLAISRPCEVTELIARTRGGLCCEHDPGKVADALEKFWQYFKAGRAWEFNEDARCVFEAHAAVGRLCEDFDRTVARYVSVSSVSPGCFQMGRR